jgi:carboxymethylenebutenolidase
MKQRDSERMQTTAAGALAYLHKHPAVRGDTVGALGFSMGGAWAIFLSELAPAELAAVVVFYTTGGADFAAARAAYQGHYAEGDEWEPDEEVRGMVEAMRAAGREVTLYTYPGTKHWFFEADRPEYDHDAAELAWQRTCAFLRERLTS